MPTKPCSLAILILILLSFTFPPKTSAQPLTKIDWPKFLARQDMLWTQMPTAWKNGLWTGNGQLGAMIYSDDNGKTLAWHIGRSDAVYAGDGTGGGLGALGGVRVAIGHLTLKPVGKITSVTMRLDLWNAEADGTLHTAAGEISFRSFTHAQQMVQVVQITPTAGESGCTFEWTSEDADNPRFLKKKTPVPPAEHNPPAQLSESDGLHLAIQNFNPKGGDVTAWKQSADSGPRSILLSVGFSPTDIEAARSQAIESVQKAETAGLDALTKSHQNWWHAYYPESFVSFPDSRLEAFYWLQMYKFASATRSDRPAIDLCGPWFERTPWPAIWWNLNIQLTYWPILTANRLDLGLSLCNMLDRSRDNLAKNAGQFSADSAAIGRASSYDCRSNASNELCDLPWALHNYYLQYRYSMDEPMMRDRIFPLLKRSMNYYIHQLKTGPDGKLHLTNGYSPEYPDQPSPNPDCNIDLALLRWGCTTLLDTCRRDGIDDPLIPTWKTILQNLTPYPTDQNGLMVSASVPFAVSHRHYSHLFCIFPLYLVTWDQPQNRVLIAKSLAHWQENPKAFQGYSYTGGASISAMMNRGDDAEKYLNRLLDTKIFPNTMYAESGPCVETPLSAAAAINDMLLSSWGDKIRLFPGLPKSWPDVTIQNLRAQGAFLITAVRKQGRTQFVFITSLAGQPCRLWTDIQSPVADDNIPIKNLGDGVIEISLKKGQSALVHSRGESPDLTIAPVEKHTGPPNFYGLHQN